MRKLRNSELIRLSLDEFKSEEKLPVVVVLDNIRSLHNIGSVFRTCDALLVSAIYLCGYTAQPPHPEIHKTALGATDSVAWKYYGDTNSAVNDLKAEQYEIIAIEQVENSCALNEYIPDREKRFALIFGNEVKGVNQSVLDICDLSIEIPQFGTKHSFNISVSVGIVLWDFFQKLRLS